MNTTSRTRRTPIVLIAIGLLTAAAHLVLGPLAGILGTGGWVSGVVLGLLVAGLGNHLRMFGRR
jgi:hypothetical protein